MDSKKTREVSSGGTTTSKCPSYYDLSGHKKKLIGNDCKVLFLGESKRTFFTQPVVLVSAGYDWR